MIFRQVFWLPLPLTAFPFAIQTVAHTVREVLLHFKKWVTAAGPFPSCTGFPF